MGFALSRLNNPNSLRAVSPLRAARSKQIAYRCSMLISILELNAQYLFELSNDSGKVSFKIYNVLADKESILQ
jgi:hypothetical protein